MKCLIVDDDELLANNLASRIKEIPFLSLEGICLSALEASGVLMKNKIDLLFLDVMMPGMTGLQFIKSLAADKPQIILVTSEKEYALDAFEFEVTDFLLKPVSDERLLKAVMKAKKNHESEGDISSSDNHLFIKVNSRLVKINMKDIKYVNAMDDYVVVYTLDAKFVIHSTMKSVENVLGSKDFLRVHNSYIVRLDKIAEIEDNTIVMGKELIPVSRSKMNGLMQRLKTL